MWRLRDAVRPGVGAVFALAGGGISPLHGLNRDRRTLCSEVSPTEQAHVNQQARVQAHVERLMRMHRSSSQELVGVLEEVEDQWLQRDKLHKIVLTGGPCAGKSTVLADLVKCLKEKNFLVFTMPEVATLMYQWSGGHMWDDFGEDGPSGDKSWAELQILMTAMQMNMEDVIEKMAKRSLAVRWKSANPPRGAVIILDRGVVDNKAYCTQEAWALVLEELGTTTARLRDLRYQHVIHLVTAANGAQEFYTLVQADAAGNDSARMETVEEAIEIDWKIQEAWNGVQNLHIVGNQRSFDKKRQQVKDTVLQIVHDGDGPSSEGEVKRYHCQFIPAHEIKKFAESDPMIRWPVLINTSLIHLSDIHSLQKYSTPGQANIYYLQTRDSDGSVRSISQIDGWNFLQKVRVARDTGQQTRESLEDLVMFTFKDAYFRCRCSEAAEKQQSLIVEVGVNPGDIDAKPEFPKWLRPLHELP